MDRPLKVNQTSYRTIWPAQDGRRVQIIDQTRLPHEFIILELETVDAVAEAIKVMRVRGAPLIGAAAAYGVAIAMYEDATTENLERAVTLLGSMRPTAVNLHWALDDMRSRLFPLEANEREAIAYLRAAEICNEDVEINQRIGEHMLPLIGRIAAMKAKGTPVRALPPERTHATTHPP